MQRKVVSVLVSQSMSITELEVCVCGGVLFSSHLQHPIHGFLIIVQGHRLSHHCGNDTDVVSIQIRNVDMFCFHDRRETSHIYDRGEERMTTATTITIIIMAVVAGNAVSIFEETPQEHIVVI